MRSIGLTGGIASGKTTVSDILVGLGAVVIDADKLGHQTYEPGSETYRQVVAAFGEDVVGEDSAIDRGVLGQKVFGNPDELKRLTDIVWPGIRRLAEAELQSLVGRGIEVALLEAAVMIEAGWQDLVDEVWVVRVPPEIARERMMKRNGLTEEQANQRIGSQISNAAREAHAHVILDTDCSLGEVRTRVQAAWDALSRRLAATS